MISSRAFVAGCAAALLLWGSAAVAGPHGTVEYELLAGSRLEDSCRDCDRIPVVRDLEGTFLFSIPEDPSAPYELSEVDLRSPEGDYTVSGSGLYRIRFDATTVQEATLDVAVNGVAGVVLSGGPVEVEAPFPAIDITFTEPGDRDPLHLYTVRLRAAQKVTGVRYELEEGSVFIDDCPICGRLTIPVPITGTFLLGEIDGAPNPIATYRVDGLDFRGGSGELEYHVRGAGFYRQGGEVALLQEMQLEIQVNDAPAVRLASEDPAVLAEFPRLDIELEHQDPQDPLHVYSLHILARPAAVVEREFRRGDANDDGGVDVSDPVSLLRWLFLGSAAPGCRDAADFDGDGEHDISDAIYGLHFLFLGGPPPPSPGPVGCGPAGAISLGCQRFDSC